MSISFCCCVYVCILANMSIRMKAILKWFPDIELKFTRNYIDLSARLGFVPIDFRYTKHTHTHTNLFSTATDILYINLFTCVNNTQKHSTAFNYAHTHTHTRIRGVWDSITNYRKARERVKVPNWNTEKIIVPSIIENCRIAFASNYKMWHKHQHQHATTIDIGQLNESRAISFCVNS